MNTVVELIIGLFKKYFSHKPLILSIEAYSMDKILLRNIYKYKIVILKYKPKNMLYSFQQNLICEPNNCFYLYPTKELTLNERAQITLSIKTSLGKKFKIKIQSEKKSLKIKY